MAYTATTMQDCLATLQDNLSSVRDRIAEATAKAERDIDEVCLVGVTKYVDVEVTRQLVAAGCNELGESRPQTLWPKAEALNDLDIRWHQIGHLQRNKLRKTLPLVSLVHSVDRVRLLDAINDLQGELSPADPKSILLEVNASGDTAKHGFSTDTVRAAIDLLPERPHIRLRGLMCMAGFGTTADEARRDFAKLRTLRDALAEEYPALDFSELSMGMSGDFEAAIAEGATIVRVGSILFEGVR